MTNLSVNVNKVALLRNSRNTNNPDLLSFCNKVISLGAFGITIHPRPDERHIRYQDAFHLKENLTCELNIEGYPNKKFLDMVCEVKPAQCTLVPDPPEALTSSFGWDCSKHQTFLQEVIARLHENNIRSSIFLNPDVNDVIAAKKTNCNRIELYTEPYAARYKNNKNINDYKNAAKEACNLNLAINAGHDLNLDNLAYFIKNVPSIVEVSIGHQLIVDSLYLGVEEVMKRYLSCLKK